MRDIKIQLKEVLNTEGSFRRLATALGITLLLILYWVCSSNDFRSKMLHASTQSGTAVNKAEESAEPENLQKGEEGVHASDEEAIGSGGSDTEYLAEAGKFSVENFDPTVWVLIFLFNVALAVSIERTWHLYRNRGNNSELVEILTRGLSEGASDSAGLIRIARDKKYGMEGRVAAKTLEGWPYGQKAMIEFSKAAIGAENRALDKRLVVLSTLGNNTPFIGLLGTVLGIMKAFRDLALVGDAGPSVVMKGISEALIATAFGLGVAIPCVIAFNAFSKQVKNRLSNAQEIVDMISGLRSIFETKGSEGVKKIAVVQSSSDDTEEGNAATGSRKLAIDGALA